MTSISLTDLSQIQERNDDTGNGEEMSANNPLTRRKLSRQFNSETNTQHPMLLRSRNVLSSINLNVANVPKGTRKFFQAGTDKMNQKLRDVRLTFGTWSQRLKNPTRRRERLINNSPYTPGRTPRTKQLLGRTPTKLYSPFGIETPSDRLEREHQNFFGKPGTYTPTRRQDKVGNTFDSAMMYSPTQAFPTAVQNVREGVEDFNRAAEGVVRRSLRQQMSAMNL